MGYYTGKLMGVQAVSGDADAQAFITATGISDSTQISAVNTLVASLKSYGLWTKMKAIYPFVGGTATTHKFNLKDPRDLDVAFRLTFTGSITHSLFGVKGGGGGHAETYLNELNEFSDFSNHVSIYSRSDIDALSCDIGTVYDEGTANGTQIFPRYNNNYLTRNMGAFHQSANTDSRGFFLNSRLSSISYNKQKNNTQVQITSNYIQRANLSFWIFDRHLANATSNTPSPRELSFSSIGTGLDNAECLSLYTIIQAYQTTLGRQV